MKGSSDSSGALVVPLLTPDGCAGLLAIELQPATAQTRSSRAVATILASVLGQLVVRLKVSDPQPQPERVRRPRTVSFTGPADESTALNLPFV